MWATNEVLRFAAAVVVGLVAALLLRGHRRDASALASVFLLVAAASHLTFPLLLNRGAATPIRHGVLLLAMAAPLAFWLLAEVHFDALVQAGIFPLLAFLVPAHPVACSCSCST